MTDWLKIATECAEEVMKDLGPYYTEGVYHAAIMHEFRLRNIACERGRTIEIFYKGYSIGTKITDCILNPASSAKSGSEYLLEFKAVKKIEKKNRMQAEVYLTSMNLDRGAVLNFNNDAGDVNVEEVQRQDLSWTKRVSLPGKTVSKKVHGKLLKSLAEDIIKYLGHGFHYEADGSKIYIAALAVELRLQGYQFTSVEHPVLYKGLPISGYAYDFQFPSGEVVKIVSFESEKKLNEKIEEWEALIKRFKLKNAFLLALPQKDGDAVVAREA